MNGIRSLQMLSFLKTSRRIIVILQVPGRDLQRPAETDVYTTTIAQHLQPPKTRFASIACTAAGIYHGDLG